MSNVNCRAVIECEKNVNELSRACEKREQKKQFSQLVESFSAKLYHSHLGLTTFAVLLDLAADLPDVVASLTFFSQSSTRSFSTGAGGNSAIVGGAVCCFCFSTKESKLFQKSPSLIVETFEI